MKILILFATTEGQTYKIASFMGDVLKSSGHEVTAVLVTENPPAPGNFDAVIIGSSIHIKKFNPAIEAYIRQHKQVLNQKRSAFFSVCMAVVSKNENDRQEAKRIMDDFLISTGWNPGMRTQVAGAVKYTQYNFLTRLLMKWISGKEGGSTDTSKDHEYTDWNAVKIFAEEFAA